MIIGVISDTHSHKIPAAVLERFRSVELIIHAGDICDMQTLKLLSKIAPVKAVQGNMDEMAVKKVLPVREVFVYGDLKIGITHGHVGPEREALKNAMSSFKGDKMDVVVFGHSHRAFNEKIEETLYFNPGSPNDVVKARFFSYGLINIEAGKIKAEIIKLNE